MNIQNNKIAIIGAGIAGLDIARKIHPYAERVYIFEKKDDYSGSKAASGISAVKGANLGRTDLFSAKIDGGAHLNDWLDDIENQSGETIERICGAEEKANISNNWSFKFERAFHGEPLGLHRLDYSREDTLSYPMDIAFHPHKLLMALRKCLPKKVEFRSEEVKDLDLSTGSQKIFLKKSESISVDRIILASGYGIEALLPQDVSRKIGFQNSFGQTIVSSSKIKNRFFINGTMNYSSFDKDSFFGSSSFSNIENKKKIIENLQSSRRVMLNELNVDISNDETIELLGVRSRTRDRHPIVGAMGRGSESLLVCGGLYKNGYQLVSNLSDYLVDIFLSRKPRKISEKFLIDRYL